MSNVTSEIYYQARKKGLRAYNQALQKHEDPYLPTLHELNPEYEGLPRISLGVMQIQIDRIAGTVTRGRSTAFAKNFMPLLEPESEFAAKWFTLYEDVIDNGVRQAVSVVEYMGYYYLLEGNKRVSVMTELHSPTIEADVTRYLAPKADTPESRAYYAYIAFSAVTGVYDILFSKESDYTRLMAQTGYPMEGKWNEDQRKELRAIYLNFCDRYKELLKNDAAMSAGDAFMAFVVAYGYKKIAAKSFIEVDEDIEKMRGEFERHSMDDEVNIILDKADNRSGKLLNHLFGPSKIKVAFLYTRPPMESGWNHWHDVGRLSMENALGGKVETSTHIIPSRSAFDGEIEKLIKNGTKLIFATSPIMLNSCIRPSLEHPEVRLLCCSLLASYHNVRSYYLRTYEAKFLLGMAAGMLADNGKIGYIADYPIYGSAAAVNAFAMGARMTNPRAKVWLRWSTVKDFDEESIFDSEEIKVICNRDITAPSQASLQYGLYVKENGIIRNVGMPVYDWGAFYSYMAEGLLKGNFDDDKSGLSALDYWWGMSSDAIDVEFADDFDAFGLRLIKTFRTKLIEGSFTPFEGPITDNDGIMRCGNEQRLTPAEVMCMDYLVDNVVGTFPKMDELAENAIPITRIQGIGSDIRPDVTKISWLQK